jgi:DNA-binding transcriptional MerR regulator
MRIGQAAEQAVLEPSAIRFYESAGVLPQPGRSEAGYRVYDETDIELMGFVRRLRALELPLDDIREIVRLRTSDEAPCQPVREAIAREAEAVDDRIAELTRLRSELRSLQKRMDAIVNRWPQSCVCHVIEEKASIWSLTGSRSKRRRPPNSTGSAVHPRSSLTGSIRLPIRKLRSVCPVGCMRPRRALPDLRASTSSEQPSGRRADMVTSINRGGLLELIDQGAEVVDALSDAEYAAQYIPGAISIPLRRLNVGNHL